MTGDEPQGTMGRVETARELCMSNMQFAIRAISVFTCNLIPVESFPRCQNSAVN